MSSQDLRSEENLVRFVGNKSQITQTFIDPLVFILRPIDQGCLSAWMSDNTSLSERWKVGDTKVFKKGCHGSADLTAKDLYSVPAFKLSAKLTSGRHVSILGLPSPDKSEALQAAQELVRIATPVPR